MRIESAFKSDQIKRVADYDSTKLILDELNEEEGVLEEEYLSVTSFFKKKKLDAEIEEHE